MPSNHLILYCPLLLLPSIFPSIRVFSNESVLCIWWPKYCSFSFNISPSNEYSGLISFRMDWLDLLAVQGRVFSNTTVPKHQFFGAQLSLQSNSHSYMTTGKTIALNRQIYSSISGNHLSLSSTPKPFFLKHIFDSFRFLWIVRTSERSSSSLITNCYLPQPCFSCRSSPLPRC